MGKIKNIVLIGAGNVATHLAFAFENAGLQILQVYSRTLSSAKTLANELYTDYTINITDVNPGADLYIISISDDVIYTMVGDLKLKNQLVVHTSGSVTMDAINPVSENVGVFYPLQTFSKSKKVDFKNIPICIEANNEENTKLLISLAENISSNVNRIDSEERKILHLAAVFACNFPNLMYTVSENILKGKNLDFNLLRPLIIETASKVQKMDPGDAQTGPARRGDEKIMKQHLEMLKDYPGFEMLYKLISSEIQKY